MNYLVILLPSDLNDGNPNAKICLDSPCQSFQEVQEIASASI